MDGENISELKQDAAHILKKFLIQSDICFFQNTN